MWCCRTCLTEQVASCSLAIRGQIRAEKPAVGRFIREAMHSSKAKVDCTGREVPRFQVHSVSDHHSLAER